MPWVLIIILVTGNGVSTSSTYFSDEGSCKAALMVLQPQLQGVQHHELVYVLSCSPTRTAS